MRSLNTRTKYKIVGSDFSAQEPRLTAFLSGDPNMAKAYAEGKDLYCVIAASMFNNKYEDNLEYYKEGTEIEIDGKKVICGHKTNVYEAGKKRRKAAKVMLLAICYGMSARTAGMRMGKTPEEGQELMDNFFKDFPKVKEAIDKTHQALREHGYVEDAFGRRRHLPDYFLPPYEARYKDPDKLINQSFNPILACKNRPMTDSTLQEYVARAKSLRSNREYEALALTALTHDGVVLQANTGRIAQAERQSFNARIQGSAASVTKKAMIDITRDPELLKYGARLIITVHDEVLVECPEVYAEQVKKRLPEVMVGAVKNDISIPMACDPAVVSRWGTDEVADTLREELSKLIEGDAKKGVKGMPREQAFEKMYAKYPEFGRDVLDACLKDGEDLNFDLEGKLEK